MKAFLKQGDKQLAKPLRRGRHGLSAERVATSQRVRLLVSMTHCVGTQGYGAVTIENVTTQADVSKKTFYAHFSSKEQCFSEAYKSFSEHLLDSIDTAYRDASGPWFKRYEAGTRAYLATLEDQPVITRALMIEVLAAGSTLLAQRRAVLIRFAQQMHAIHQRAQAEDPAVAPVDPRLFEIAVGGIDELVRNSLGTKEAGPLGDLSTLIVLNFCRLLSKAERSQTEVQQAGRSRRR